MGLAASPRAGGDATWTQGGLFPNLPDFLNQNATCTFIWHLYGSAGTKRSEISGGV